MHIIFTQKILTMKNEKMLIRKMIWFYLTEYDSTMKTISLLVLYNWVTQLYNINMNKPKWVTSETLSHFELLYILNNRYFNTDILK